MNNFTKHLINFIFSIAFVIPLMGYIITNMFNTFFQGVYPPVTVITSIGFMYIVSMCVITPMWIIQQRINQVKTHIGLTTKMPPTSFEDQLVRLLGILIGWGAIHLFFMMYSLVF